MMIVVRPSMGPLLGVTVAIEGRPLYVKKPGNVVVP
jgi:hypothetical protein